MPALKSYVILVALFFSFNINAKDKYEEIDALLRTNSMSDAMQAMELLTAKFAKDTVKSEYWLKYAKAASASYKYEEAEKALTKAITIEPKNAANYYERGFFYNKMENLNAALQDFETAVSFDPNQGEYSYWKGIVNHQLNNTESALKDYAQALANKFESPELYNNMAIIFTDEGNVEEGLRSANKAIALDDKYAEVYALRAKIHILQLQADEACKDAATAYSLRYRQQIFPYAVCDRSEKTKWEYLAEINLMRKRYENAIAAYTKLIENETVKSDYYLNRGFSYFNLKNYKQAESDYLKALDLPNPNRDLLYDNLSLLYFNQDDFLKSAEYASKRIELNPENHVAYLDRGLAYRKMKKYTEAENDFRKSLSIRPDFFRAFGYLSFLYYELGEYEKALENATKSVELNAQYGYGHLMTAQVKQKLGLPDFCADYQLAAENGEPDGEIGMNLYCK